MARIVDYVTQQGAAERIGCDPRLIARAITAGELATHATGDGKVSLILIADVVRWAAGRPLRAGRPRTKTAGKTP